MTVRTYMVEHLLEEVVLAEWYREVSWEVEAADSDEVFVWHDRQAFPDLVCRFRLTYMEADVDSGETTKQCGRWWYVEQGMSDEAVLKTIWAALTMSDDHRRREGFSYRGFRVFDPHAPLRRLERPQF